MTLPSAAPSVPNTILNKINIGSAGERPTFHEIRALGAWLYEQQGFEQEYIQSLMGHADVKPTENFQAGHGDDEEVYMKAKADLKP